MQIVGLHQIVGSLLGLPELFISPEEGTAVAQVVIDISREYKIKIDHKYTILINAGLVLSMIYAPRVGQIVMRKREAVKKQKEQQVQREQAVADREDRPVNVQKKLDDGPVEGFRDAGI